MYRIIPHTNQTRCFPTVCNVQVVARTKHIDRGKLQHHPVDRLVRGTKALFLRVLQGQRFERVSTSS